VRSELCTAAIEKQQDSVLIIEMNAASPLRPHVVYANAAFFALTGYDPESIANGGFPVILGPESDRTLIVQCARRVAAGEAVTCEVRLYRADGSAFWADVRSHPLDTPTYHCVLNIRDITERRASHERISLLSHALEEAGDFVIITEPSASSPSGQSIVYVNQAFLDATGYSSDRLVGQSSLAFCSDSNNPATMAAIRRNISLGLQNEREAVLERNDGSTFWIEIVAKPFVTSPENRPYRICIARDITQRKHAQNQTSLMLGAIETSLDRITLYDLDREGKLAVSYENQAAAATGRHRLLDLMNSDAPIADELRAAIANGGYVRRVVTDRNDAGGLSALEFTAQAIGNAGGEAEAILTLERCIADVDQSAGDAT
jgi:PAS domain S-box-containing protein